MKRKLSAVVLTALSITLLSAAGCSRKSDPISKTGFYFDTVISITLYDEKESEYLDGCFALAKTYEDYFSTTIEDSDISKINTAKGANVEVHDETIDLIEKGISYCELSNGGFDITIGALSSLWNFGHNDGTLPDAAAIEEAVSSIDYRNIQIDGNTVMLTNPDAQLDLGAIAKGYIADQMKSYLNENGVTSGIINLGGNVLVVGPKPDGSNYNIAIQKPFAEEGTALAALGITNQTVVSSGIYERYFERDGVLYHHILNPATGYPYGNELSGLSIVCEKSVDGDGLSTTCFSLGLEKGMALIESLADTEAVFLTKDGAIHKSSGIGSTIPYETVSNP